VSMTLEYRVHLENFRINSCAIFFFPPINVGLELVAFDRKITAVVVFMIFLLLLWCSLDPANARPTLGGVVFVVVLWCCPSMEAI